MKTKPQVNPGSTRLVDKPVPQRVSFAVADVPLAEKMLAEVDYHVAIEAYMRGPVEACPWQDKRLVQVSYHPFAAAMHCAYAHHRPLIISPDHIWLLLCQGFASHVNANAEALRAKFVEHEGQKEIEVRRDDFVKGNPTNPWPEVFPEFCKQIREEIGDTHDLLLANFSTTGPVEKAACEITLMDAMQSYFSYSFSTVCGIPAITLEGTPDDWQSVADRVEQFSRFELGWWVKALRPILKQFVQAAQGHIDLDFWHSIYKKVDPGSGEPYIHGWFIKFFPYITRGGGPASHRNQYITEEAHTLYSGLTTDSFPSGLSKAPFTWFYYNEVFKMEFLAGFVGMEQDTDSLALRPEIGWAVRETSET